MNELTIAIGYSLLVVVDLLALTVIAWIWMGKIPLYKLLSEPNGDASLSRLQFLIFTFVIALSFFLVTIGGKVPAFPNPFPAEVLTLLGISGSSYLVSKGIQFSNPAGITPQELNVSPGKLGPAPAAPQVFTATVPGVGASGAIPTITWSLDSPALGSLTTGANGTATYTPGTEVEAGKTVTIRAQAPGYTDGIAVVTY